MERPDSPYFSHSFSAKTRRFFEQIDERLDAPQQGLTFDQLEDQPNYIDKLVFTPLPIETLARLVDKMTEKYLEQSQLVDFYTSNFLQALEIVTSDYSHNSQSGDHVAFDDLITEVDIVLSSQLSPNKPIDVASPSFEIESQSIREICYQFAVVFESDITQEYIGDHIDEWTVNPDVHPAQKERWSFDPDCRFHGERHGYKGRWTAQLRGSRTVWTPNT